MVERYTVMEFPFIHKTDHHTAWRGIWRANWDSKDLGKNEPVNFYMAVFYIKGYDSIELFK